MQKDSKTELIRQVQEQQTKHPKQQEQNSRQIYGHVRMIENDKIHKNKDHGYAESQDQPRRTVDSMQQLCNKSRAKPGIKNIAISTNLLDNILSRSGYKNQTLKNIYNV